MDSSLDLHAPIVTLIFLWVLDLAYFSYDQHQKIKAFSIEIERADADGSSSTRIIIRALLENLCSAISLSLKALSMLFFAVAYRSIDDEQILQQYSSRLAMTWLTMTLNFFAATTAASLAFFLMISGYSYYCAYSRTSTNKTTSCGRYELAVPLLQNGGDEILPGMVVAATGV